MCVVVCSKLEIITFGGLLLDFCIVVKLKLPSCICVECPILKPVEHFILRLLLTLLCSSASNLVFNCLTLSASTYILFFMFIVHLTLLILLLFLHFLYLPSWLIPCSSPLLSLVCSPPPNSPHLNSPVTLPLLFLSSFSCGHFMSFFSLFFLISLFLEVTVRAPAGHPAVVKAAQTVT